MLVLVLIKGGMSITVMPRTNLNVMVDRNTNKFISGWRLSDEQIINMKNNDNIQ